MAVTRISRTVVKQLVAAALNTALTTTLRLRTEIDAAHPQTPEAEVRYRLRRMTMTMGPRKANEGEPDTARIRLEVGVRGTGEKSLDDAVDALAAVLDKPAALIDATTATRVEFERMHSDDEPGAGGENEADASAVCTVEGVVIRNPS